MMPIVAYLIGLALSMAILWKPFNWALDRIEQRAEKSSNDTRLCDVVGCTIAKPHDHNSGPAKSTSQEEQPK